MANTKSLSSIFKEIPSSLPQVKDAYANLGKYEKILMMTLSIVGVLKVITFIPIVIGLGGLQSFIAIPIILLFDVLIFLVIPYTFILFVRFVETRCDSESSIYKFISPKGRLNRIDFFIGTVILQSILIFIVLVIITLLHIVSSIYASSIILYVTLPVTLVLFCVAIIFLFLYSSVIITLKRISDVGKSRWLALVLLIPPVNIIFSIALFFIKGADSPVETIGQEVKDKA